MVCDTPNHYECVSDNSHAIMQRWGTHVCIIHSCNKYALVCTGQNSRAALHLLCVYYNNTNTNNLEHNSFCKSHQRSQCHFTVAIKGKLIIISKSCCQLYSISKMRNIIGMGLFLPCSITSGPVITTKELPCSLPRLLKKSIIDRIHPYYCTCIYCGSQSHCKPGQLVV